MAAPNGNVPTPITGGVTLKRNGGIYAIVCTMTGGYYVGSTVNFKNRFGQHRSLLRAGRHTNSRLQRSWKKYGEQDFAFVVLVRASTDRLEAAECAILQQVVGKEECFNASTEFRGINRGRKWSPEVIARMRAAQANRPQRGPCSTEQRIAISESLKGIVRSQEWRERNRAWLAVWNPSTRGSKHTPETKAKIAESNRRRGVSAETRAKISAALTGRTLAEEHRAKLRAARQRQEETRRAS